MNRTRRVIIAAAMAAPLLSLARNASAAAPEIAVSKDPNCGCCAGWVAHLRSAGFSVAVTDTSDLDAVKARLGVPSDLVSCHTAQAGTYVIEGHVPASAVRRLLAERPRAAGLAVPGMPIGSPGMEVPGAAPDTYDVVLFGDGIRRTFARYRGAVELPN